MIIRSAEMRAQKSNIVSSIGIRTHSKYFYFQPPWILFLKRSVVRCRDCVSDLLRFFMNSSSPLLIFE